MQHRGLASGPERHSYTIHGRLFDLPPRYEFHKAADHDGGGSVGHATYGAVCESFDRALGIKVTIKKLEDLHADDTPRLARLVQEVRLLSRLNHYGVVRLLECFGGRGVGGEGDVRDVYLVVPSYACNLLGIIRSEQVLTKAHVRIIAFQLLEAVRYLHDHGVIATRLCPANILCDVDCSLCIGELGAALPTPPDARTPNAHFIRDDKDERSEPWYKAPELLLKAPHVGATCDIWSIGAIVAEVMYRRPLFPGRDCVAQLRLITDTLGISRPRGTGASVSAEEIADAAAGPLRFLGRSVAADRSRQFLLSMGPKLAVPLRTLLPKADKFVVDLLERALTFAPDGRATAEQLLEHPYFDELTPHEAKLRKRSEEELGVVLDGAVLAAVEPGSAADRAGLSQFVGYHLTHVNGAPAQHQPPPHPDALSQVGRGTTQVTLRFGGGLSPEHNHLARVGWHLADATGPALQRALREELRFLGEGGGGRGP